MKPNQYVLYCKPAGTYNSPNGGYTKDLNKATLFSAEQAVEYADQFAPNFEFRQVSIKGAERTLVS
jgi:hypothetical protein